MKENELNKEKEECVSCITPLWKKILSAFFVVLSVMLIYVLIWTKDVFGDIPFSQVIFHLMVPMDGADSSLVWSYFKGVMPVIVAAVGLFFLPYLHTRLAKGKDGKRVTDNRISRFYKRHVVCITSILLVCCTVTDVFGFGIHVWIVDRLDSSTIFEDYYVNAGQCNITFPEKKKNIIYILSESLEASFTSEENGGCMDKNYIPNLTKLAMENTHFSSRDNLAGAIEVQGTGWTVAAMVSQFSGVPLMVPIGNNSYGRFAEFLPGVVTLGEILEKAGYQNEIMMGSDSEFAGMDNFYTQHGNYTIFDYYTAIEQDYIDEDYYEFWGYEDAKLFDYAKIEVSKLANSDKPFNLTINTIDLHTSSGYKCSKCKNIHDDKYKNVMNCQDNLIIDFISWCKQQDFYEDTVIIVAGDHLSMAPVVKNEYVPEGYERTTYHAIINSDVEAINTENRLFTTMDMFPTILASMGCTIEGDRLGIGTNLYSDKETVMEIMGKENFMDEISKNSQLYNEKIIEME